ncbi:MAG: hypothetical protein HY059_04990 [Proteobacteria bacterium]|nr:hypothetical protein [Pseudomonadota bacterium]
MLLRRALLAAIAAAACGCAASGRGGAPVDRPQAETRAALRALSESYSQPRAEAFFERVDPSRFPAFEGFRESVRQFQVRNRQIVLDVIIDGVDAAEPDLGVRAHWNKSWVEPAGGHKLSHGECEFFFRRQPSGGLLLTGVRGASPF